MGSAGNADVRIKCYDQLRVALRHEPSISELTDLLAHCLGPSTTAPVADIDGSAGAEASNVITVTFTLRDGHGNAVTERHKLSYWVSSDSTGATINSDLGTLAAASASGTLLTEHVDDVMGECLSNASGVMAFDFTSTSAQTSYLNVAHPNGKVVTVTVTHA